MGYSWQGVLTHVFMLSLVPAYLTLRWCLSEHWLQRTSIGWITAAGLFELYYFTKFTIPYIKSPLQNVPSAPGERFILGHSYVWGEQPGTNVFSEIIKNTPNDGLIAVWGPLYIRQHLVPTTTENIMDILNGHTYDWEKPSAAKRILAPILGQGLVNVEGNVHKGMRRAVAPAFSGRHIRDLIPLFWEKGVQFTESMARAVGASPDGAVEMSGMMSSVTLDIIGSAGVGKDLNTVENNEDELVRLYEAIVAPDRGNLLAFYVINAFVPHKVVQYMYGTAYAAFAKATIALHEKLHTLLREKQHAMNEKTADQKDIIAIIMRSGNFSDEYLTSQLLTFLAAGHDTTASALTFASWVLATNQGIQDKLRKECIDTLAGRKVDDIDAETFDGMKYLNAVCNETLRLWPTVPVTARHAIVDTRIGDTYVPKHMHVCISPWAINRLPSLWGADAEECRPERWIEGPLAATGGAKSQHASLTFLHGPRSCIGQSFARLEMRCVLATLVMRFRFEMLDPEQSFDIDGLITIKPKGGLKLKLHDLQAAA